MVRAGRRRGHPSSTSYRRPLTVHPGDLIGGGAFYYPASGTAQVGVCNFSTGAGCVNRTFATAAPSTGAVVCCDSTATWTDADCPDMQSSSPV